MAGQKSIEDMKVNNYKKGPASNIDDRSSSEAYQSAIKFPPGRAGSKIGTGLRNY